MKKTYVKPEIMFEDFTLCTSIATGCEIVIPTPVSDTCGYAYEGGNGQTMFTKQVAQDVCFIQVDDDEGNGFCYHVPVEGNNMFNS